MSADDRHFQTLRAAFRSVFGVDGRQFYIAGIEAGLRNPSVKAIAKIAKGLSVALSKFFDGVE